MTAAAERVRCSLVEFLRDLSPDLRRKAIMLVRAEAAARDQRHRATGGG